MLEENTVSRMHSTFIFILPDVNNDYIKQTQSLKKSLTSSHNVWQGLKQISCLLSSQIAVQATFNEQEGNPNIYDEPPPPEPRAPAMNLEPSDQRSVLAV